jgi:hypothetical protein
VIPSPLPLGSAAQWTKHPATPSKACDSIRGFAIEQPLPDGLDFAALRAND